MHATKHGSGMKKNIDSPRTDLRRMALGEKSRLRKPTYCVTAFIQHSRNDEVTEIGEQEEWCQGLGEGEGQFGPRLKGSAHSPQVGRSRQTLGDHVIQLTPVSSGGKKTADILRHRHSLPPGTLAARPDLPNPPRGKSSQVPEKALVLHCLTVEQNRDPSERLPKWI